MTTCSVCGGRYDRNGTHDCLRSIRVRLEVLEHDMRARALESAQRPQPQPSCKWCGGVHGCDCIERMKCALAGWPDHPECGTRDCGCPNFIKCEHAHPAPPRVELWDEGRAAAAGGGEPRCRHCGLEDHAANCATRELLPCPFCGEPPSEPHQMPLLNGWWELGCKRCDYAIADRKTREEIVAAWNGRGATPPAPADATGSDDDDLIARLRMMGQGKAISMHVADRAATRLDELRRQATGYERGWRTLRRCLDLPEEPGADGGRDVLDKLDELRREQGVITIGDGLRVGRHWVEALQARAYAAEAKVAGIAGLVRKIGPDTVADCAHIIRKDWPLCAEILDAALTTPAQRSESNDGG
jgi:hypothetical protein